MTINPATGKQMTQYDALVGSMEEAEKLMPGMGAMMGLPAMKERGKCSPSGNACPRNPETGECSYCAMMEQELAKGITLTYADGSSETLVRKPRKP